MARYAYQTEWDWPRNRELAEQGKSFHEIERTTGTAFRTISRVARRERWRIPVWLRNAFFHLRSLETARGVPCYLDGGDFGASLRESLQAAGKKLELLPDIECDILLKRVLWSRPPKELVKYIAIEDVSNAFQAVREEMGELSPESPNRERDKPEAPVSNAEIVGSGFGAPDSGLVSPGLSVPCRFTRDRSRMAKRVSRAMREAGNTLPKVESWRDVKLLLEIHRELFGVAPLTAHTAPDTPLNVDGLGKVSRPKRVTEQE